MIAMKEQWLPMVAQMVKNPSAMWNTWVPSCIFFLFVPSCCAVLSRSVVSDSLQPQDCQASLSVGILQARILEQRDKKA